METIQYTEMHCEEILEDEEENDAGGNAEEHDERAARGGGATSRLGNPSTRKDGTHEDQPPSSPVTTEETASEEASEDSETGVSTTKRRRLNADPQGEEPLPQDEGRPETLQYGYGARTWMPAVAAVPPSAWGDAEEQGLQQESVFEVSHYKKKGFLAEKELSYYSRRVESERIYADDYHDVELAYPYARRYARRLRIWENTEFFGHYLGLRKSQMVRHVHGGREEFATHPSVLSSLIHADWRLETSFDAVEATPISPRVVASSEINTALFDYNDGKLSAAPMFAPVVAAISFASRKTWLPVQRGMLQELEELVRAALIAHSSLLHGWDEVQRGLGNRHRDPSLYMAFETLLSTQTAVLVELLHHLVYAHRMAYVRGCEEPLRHEILRQPVYGQRQLFTVQEFQLLDLD
jgi:hypothetical protein